ncbi:hypothetical protein AAF712_012190, partial [Marasmius tenuissimus]
MEISLPFGQWLKNVYRIALKTKSLFERLLKRLESNDGNEILYVEDAIGKYGGVELLALEYTVQNSTQAAPNGGYVDRPPVGS